MKKKVSVLLLVGITLLLVFAAFGSQALAKGKENWPTVPFKASYTTYPVIVDEGADYVVMEVTATGNGTHLGRSEWDTGSILSFSSDPWTQTGDMVFTAADGAQLIGSYQGFAIPLDSERTEYWGVYEITEGTGRFTDATGSGGYYGSCFDTGVITFEGTLTNP